MPRGLPRSAGALFVTALALTGLAVFFGDGSAYAPLVWIGGAATCAAGAALALGLFGRLPLPRLDGWGWAFVALLVAFVAWNGVSIVWSVQPDRSWEYFNRGLVYLAFVALGLVVGAVVPRAPRAVALGLLAVFAAALVWALAGKVIPNLYPDGERIARLRAPLEYWNALALLAAMTMLLALWAAIRREHARALRVGAVVLVFVAAVALLLTYSRGGVVVALLALAVFLLLSRERVDAIAALFVSVPPAVALGAWAFTQPGIVENGEPYDGRLADGLQLGVGLLLAGGLVAALAYLGLKHEERWRPRTITTVSGRRLAAFSAVALLVGVLAVSRGNPVGWVRDGFQEFTNPTSQAGAGPERLADFNSNSRWTWWEEAWELFRDNPVAGTGAGTFSVARRPIRHNTTVATEPHNLALQFLAETGLVGFLLVAGAGTAATVGIARAVRRLDEGEAAAASALGVVALAYLAHALIDYDWDFVGVTAPLFLVLGVLLATGRPVAAGRREPFFAAGMALLSVAAVAALAAPWLAEREVAEAYAAIERREPSQAVDLGRKAHSLNPLSVEPFFAEAAGEEARGNRGTALDLYIEAVELQPRNPRTWFELGRFELELGDRDAAIRDLTRSRELDRYGAAVPYLQALGA
jgi:tetratricopeptide (TPR) repeat protein